MFYGSLQIVRAIDPHPHEAAVTYLFPSDHINARLFRVKVKEDFFYETLEDKLKTKQRKKQKKKQNKTKNPKKFLKK